MILSGYETAEISVFSLIPPVQGHPDGGRKVYVAATIPLARGNKRC